MKSLLHIAVRVLGIAVFHRDATRSEDWVDGRLVSFHSVTTTNGNNLDVSEKAIGDVFVINSPSGTMFAPANVHPSTPWAASALHSSVMSTQTGRVEDVRVSGGAETFVTFDGAARLLRQYVISGRKRRFVWINDGGVPIAFRVWEQGAQIGFVLRSQSAPLHQTATAPH